MGKQWTMCWKNAWTLSNGTNGVCWSYAMCIVCIYFIEQVNINGIYWNLNAETLLWVSMQYRILLFGKTPIFSGSTTNIKFAQMPNVCWYVFSFGYYWWDNYIDLKAQIVQSDPKNESLLCFGTQNIEFGLCSILGLPLESAMGIGNVCVCLQQIQYRNVHILCWMLF